MRKAYWNNFHWPDHFGMLWTSFEEAILSSTPMTMANFYPKLILHGVRFFWKKSNSGLTIKQIDSKWIILLSFRSALGPGACWKMFVSAEQKSFNKNYSIMTFEFHSFGWCVAWLDSVRILCVSVCVCVCVSLAKVFLFILFLPKTFFLFQTPFYSLSQT